MHAFLAKRMGLFCFAFTMTHTANKWVMSEAVCGEEKRHSQGQCVRRYAGKHLARLIMLSVRNERLVTVEIQEPLFQLPGHFWVPGKSPGVAARGMGAESLWQPYWFITVSWGLFVLPSSLPRSDSWCFCFLSNTLEQKPLPPDLTAACLLCFRSTSQMLANVN